MAQNIYDDPEFFAGYRQLRRSVEGLAGAPEWPTLQALLPAMRGLKVVDLGCGFGWFARWAVERGAAQVLGLDVSDNMLAEARQRTSSAAITYEKADLAALTLPRALFDLAYSSLAFHYVEDAGRLYAQIHQALRPGGGLVFSTEHPVYMAAANARWMTDSNGRKTWPVNDYFTEGRRVSHWLTNGVVKYHRTIGTTLSLLLQCGFKIEHVEEFCPTAEQIAADPSLAEERERPMFLLVSARRL